MSCAPEANAISTVEKVAADPVGERGQALEQLRKIKHGMRL
jgi:hypothetical protein